MKSRNSQKSGSCGYSKRLQGAIPLFGGQTANSNTTTCFLFSGRRSV